MKNPYSKLTDGEISVLVCRQEKPRCHVQLHPYNPKGAMYKRTSAPAREGFSFFPMTRADDGFPIVARNRIALAPVSKTTWEARHESGAAARHKNPLRAGMIVYLMICDMEAKGLSPETELHRE